MEQATTTTTTTTTPSQDAPVIVAGSESRSVPDGLRRRWSDLVESDRDWTFPFTILGIVAILLVGAIVVPLSIPDPLPEPDPSQVLAERYLMAFSAPDSPTVAAKLSVPTADQVVKSYGSDGGDACTGSLADIYGSVTTTGSTGAVVIDKEALARTKVAQSVYCPDRSAGFSKYVARESAKRMAARAAAAADAA
ncbi:MAG: hypothetical protein KDC46_02860 [Thermoleophilia bacterium]|nr:hypothetical protein [Thermoleophilia bacterium]